MMVTLMRLSSPASPSGFKSDMLKWFVMAETFRDENNLGDDQVKEFLKGLAAGWTALSCSDDEDAPETELVSGHDCEKVAYDAFHAFLPKYFEQRLHKPCEDPEDRFSEWWPCDLACEALAESTLPRKTAVEIGRLFAEREFDEALARQNYYEEQEAKHGTDWWKRHTS